MGVELFTLLLVFTVFAGIFALGAFIEPWLGIFFDDL